MLRKLSALSSRFSFSNSNYNYTNTNTNVSSHLCIFCDIDPADTAKNNMINENRWYPSGENDFSESKANEKN
jgi:hypothetical protein